MDRSSSYFKLPATCVQIGILAGSIIVLNLHILSGEWFLNISGDLSFVRTPVFYRSYGVLTGLLGFVTCTISAWYLNPSLRSYPAIIYLPLRSFILSTYGLIIPAFFIELLILTFNAHFFDWKETRWVFYSCASVSLVLIFMIWRLARVNSEVRRVKRLLIESAIKEQRLVEETAAAQLTLLQAQINLHFFYNALSSIAGLLTIDAETSRRLIVNLAEMHRYTLKCTNTRLVPFQEEVEFIKSYLSIEAVRFRSHLSIDFKLPENLDGLRIPGLVLQPVVENAIKYGAARNIEDSYVHIVIKRGEEFYSIAIYNNTDCGQSLSPENVFSDGHALKNVADRLRAIYRTEYEFSIESSGSEVCVRLRIPISEGEYHANTIG